MMKQVLGIRDEKTSMKVMPPLAVVPIAQEDDMRWDPGVPPEGTAVHMSAKE